MTQDIGSLHGNSQRTQILSQEVAQIADDRGHAIRDGPLAADEICCHHTNRVSLVVSLRRRARLQNRPDIR